LFFFLFSAFRFPFPKAAEFEHVKTATRGYEICSIGDHIGTADLAYFRQTTSPFEPLLVRGQQLTEMALHRPLPLLEPIPYINTSFSVHSFIHFDVGLKARFLCPVSLQRVSDVK
jgi:hypothetical protein